MIYCSIRINYKEDFFVRKKAEDYNTLINLVVYYKKIGKGHKKKGEHNGYN